MKRKISVTSTEITITGEVPVDGKDHLEAQKKFRSTIIKPKKGKGSSYRRSEYKKTSKDGE